MLRQYLGSADAVEMHRDGSRRVYVYKCPICKIFIRDRLKRHLVLKHQLTEPDALFKQSKMRILFLWCNKNKHGTPLPLPCEDCGEWFMRLDHHLKNHKGIYFYVSVLSFSVIFGTII